MTTTQTCESCGMPIETGRYCAYCTDETGALQSFDERFERMAGWQARRQPDASRQEIERQTLDYMATMPAWRDHPRVTAGRPAPGAAPRRRPEQPHRDSRHGRQGNAHADPLQDARRGRGRVGGERGQHRGGGQAAGQQPWPPAAPARVKPTGSRPNRTASSIWATTRST